MNTNKKVMVTTLAISALAVNVLAADNNFVGGTDNVVEAGVKITWLTAPTLSLAGVTPKRWGGTASLTGLMPKLSQSTR